MLFKPSLHYWECLVICPRLSFSVLKAARSLRTSGCSHGGPAWQHVCGGGGQQAEARGLSCTAWGQWACAGTC